MIILLFIIFFGITIISNKWFWDYEAITIISALLSVMCAIVTIGLAVGVASGTVIDEKIELYETTNEQIDKQVKEMVLAYMEYEGETFERVSEKDAETLVTLFPNLKSDELVQSQMKIYIQNKANILALKERKINLKPQKWWLYFGG